MSSLNFVILKRILTAYAARSDSILNQKFTKNVF